MRDHLLGLVAAVSGLIAVGLVVLAVIGANNIRDGVDDPLSDLGLFAYGADPVRIEPAAKDSPASLAPYSNRRLYMLGQNGQQVILYCSEEKRVVMAPINLIIVASW